MGKILVISTVLLLSLQVLAKRTPGGGVFVEPGKFPAVVKIFIQDGYCSATVIGPKTLLTAGHCFRDGPPSGYFTVKGRRYNYQAVTFQKLFGYFVDQAIVYTKEEIKGVQPMSVNIQKPTTDHFTILGWGCYTDLLNMYTLKVFDENANPYFQQLISATDDIQASCAGDSGGPALMSDPTDLSRMPKVIGILCKSNSMDKSDILKLDHIYSAQFFSAVTENYHLEICGINKTCDAKKSQALAFESF